ncbi:MAG: hypothetical protein LBB81_05660 [Treponema sp.]|jgi:hypothetical protein|nr:hypothetical protein [Treponema sp.]
MKKSWTIALLIALAVAGTLLMGCSPSEADTGKELEDYDFELKGGKYQYVFTTPKVEDGKIYTITLTIDDCSESLSSSGGHFGGKICYKMDMASTTEEDKVLSGWRNPNPDTISASPRSYVWTFEAGNQHSDDKPVVSPATTPDGATQYFDLTAQTSSWGPWEASANFKIKGKITITTKEVITNWDRVGELTLAGLDSTGKGELSAADVASILALPENGKLKVYFSVIVNDSDAQPGYGVGSIGANWGGVKIEIPGSAEKKPEPQDFTQDISMEDLISELAGATTITFNPYNGASITKVELFKPAQ